MAQHTVQLGDALDAFVTAIAALTYPVSSKKVFPGGAKWVEVGAEVREMTQFPCAVVMVSGGTLNDENGTKNHTFNISVECRVARHAEGDGKPTLFGINRDGTDNPFGAGLIDSLVKLVNGVGSLSPQDNSEFISSFVYQGFSAATPTKEYSAFVANFVANLNLT